jgi:sulfopyruvate decarboxylase TPP-binding subunit
VLQIERLIPAPLKHTVERLAARVGENQDCSPFMTRQREGLGCPSGIKFGGERVFVLQASQGLGRWRFRGGCD